jgi:hypothetical protein
MGEQQNRSTASPNQRGRNEHLPVRPPTRERWSGERTGDPSECPNCEDEADGGGGHHECA